MVGPAFGNWLAGFFDGEGSFGIYASTNSRGVRCFAKVSLRADDLPILEEARERTGLGDLWADKKGIAARESPGANPCVAWHVSRKDDCMALVELFERYPLRAKKRYDFEVWARAVRLWCAMPGKGDVRRHADWTQMEALAVELVEVRRYRAAA